MHKATFATAINCMDGRVQAPVAEWMRQHVGVEYVDMITEPGPDRVMTLGPPGGLESIRTRVLISVEKHRSRVVAICAHHDCAGNPVSRESHRDQLRECVRIIRSWKLPVRVLALWVNEQWAVEVLSDTPAGTSA